MPRTAHHPQSSLVVENRYLSQRLKTLVQEARKNESTLRRFQSLELRLLGCHSLYELLEMLLHHGCETFGWDSASLVLKDPDYEIGRLVDQSPAPADQYDHLRLVDSLDAPGTDFGTELSPRLGVFDPHRHRRLFPEQDLPLGSVASLPLVRGGQLIGGLNLGSIDGKRFQPDAATDFMEHLAAVMAVCIETSIAQERLKYAGLTDALTGVNNRRYFDQRLVEETARSLRSRQRLSCIFIDIDHFKHVNDTYGHPIGDKVLQGVAQRIREQIRSADVVARFGGEEFALLLVQTGQELAADVAERIRGVVAAGPIHPDANHVVPVTISLGVGTLHPEQHDADVHVLGMRLVEAADQALYRAKQGGRNRVQMGEPVRS